MRRTYDAAIDASVTLDDQDQIRSARFTDKPSDARIRGREKGPDNPVRSVAPKLAIPIEHLGTLEQRVSYINPAEAGMQYRLSDRKTFFDTTTHVYYQTYLNTPIWEAGLTVTTKTGSGRILSATNSSVGAVDVKLPPARDIATYRALFLTAEKTDDDPAEAVPPPTKAASERSDGLLSEILGKAVKRADEYPGKGDPLRLIRGRFFLYRYDSERRQSGLDPVAPQQSGGKIRHGDDDHGRTLPLEPVPKAIHDGDWRFVAELIIGLPDRHGPMNWRLLVDIRTHAILYLRPLASGVNGLVFEQDPITASGDPANGGTQGSAVLNPFRREAVLQGLDAPVGGTQSLSGSLVRVVEIEPPAVAAPTMPEGSNFDFDARSDEFSAVNAYYHNDRFFRMVEDLGFPLADYFDGTSFPVDIDHRGFGGGVNAHCIGDGDGIAHACYGLIDSSGGNLGIACDWGVVLHELGGHGILYDHVNSANFGFAHSAGDSFAMIMNDYLSDWHNGGTNDRFALAPFSFPGGLRRADRAVGSGWGWGGANDVGGYPSEEILMTCNFRTYRAIGGDSDQFTKREFAARMMAYLLLRAVGTLSPVSNPGDPALFLDALLTADAGDWTTENLFGGAYEKVLIWSFEKQDLDGGTPPIVDVFIDDGRGGEYDYLADFTDTQTIWNRNAPDGIDAHQEPVIGTNYAYVKIRNRGSASADNVAVRGFHSKPLAGNRWPDDMQPMTTAELSAGPIAANNAEELVIGPFEWTPVANAGGHDGMMMVVSAPGDPCNADKFGAGEEIEDWRLIPHDNNIALRKVKLLPRLVTVIADSGAFGNVCQGSAKDMTLVLSNSGFKTLSITGMASSSGDFVVPGVDTYPIIIQSGDSIEVPIRFQPGSFGPHAATIRVFSNAPNGVRSIPVSGESGPPRLVAMIAENGDFGKVCPGEFADHMLTLNNSGKCRLTISAITSSAPEFRVAGVMDFPIVVAAGDAIEVPIRFRPTDHGAASGTITIASDDPAGDKKIRVQGKAPSGQLTVTGSTCIGGVKACCMGETTIAICNSGECPLHVSSVDFSRETDHWRLVNSPFPATLQPGSCLDVLIRYKATEKCPRCVELLIHSDDPKMPVRRMDLMAYTVWPHSRPEGAACGCGRGCDCGCSCDDACGVQSLDPCCFDDESRPDHKD